MWKFDRAENAAKVEDHSAAMIAATPATIDLDYILAERSREYYGEGYRWLRSGAYTKMGQNSLLLTV